MAPEDFGLKIGWTEAVFGAEIFSATFSFVGLSGIFFSIIPTLSQKQNASSTVSSVIFKSEAIFFDAIERPPL